MKDDNLTDPWLDGSPVYASLRDEIERSRSLILGAIGDAADITFIRTYGNAGDQLIHAGFRRLFSGLRYREVGIEDVRFARGELGLVCGSGGWCRPHHSMVRHFREAENRFERLIVLPSSYDPSESTVREALANSSALFFAREKKSYELIRGICRAELAMDGAFYFDYRPYRTAGQGVLEAYREDAERAGGKVPRGSVDISNICDSLDEWLWTIARHEIVRSDRAHVIIAAAMLGKEVRYRPSSYHKIPGLVEWLEGLPVRPEADAGLERIRDYLMRRASESLKLLPEDFFERHAGIEVTIVILSYHRLDQTLNTVESISRHVRIPYRIMLIDNGSGPETRRRLEELAAGDDRIELTLLDRNLGCAGGRDYAIRRASTKYIFLLDNDEEVFPGTIEHLVDSLDRHPESPAATGKILFPDGSVHLFGGTLRAGRSVLHQELYGMGRRYDDPIGGESECNFVPGGMTLYRREFFDSYPYDLDLRYYYEDVDWCCRLLRDGLARFRRNPNSVCLHYHESKSPDANAGVEEQRSHSIRFISSMAAIRKAHGLVLGNLYGFVPELGSIHDSGSIRSAGELLDLAGALGDEEFLRRWNAGELDHLFYKPPAPTPLDRVRSAWEYISLRIKWRWTSFTWALRRALRSN